VAEPPMNAPEVVQVLALQVDLAWRRLPQAQREEDLDAFRQLVNKTAGEVHTLAYATAGLRADAHLVLIRFAGSLAALQESNSALLCTGVGRAMRVAHSFVGLLRSSRYVKRAGSQEQGLLAGERAAYLIVYPFTKTHDWYRLSGDARQGMMNEHIRIGHDFPQVRQLLAYSTGLDDQEFIVAYETDDLAAFQDLVTALRETEARRYTLRDQPILTAIYRPLDEALQQLG